MSPDFELGRSPAGLWNSALQDGADWVGDSGALVEQYKAFVELTDRVSARRDAANAFFLTAHTGLAAGAGFIFEKLNGSISGLALFPVLAALLVLCRAWSVRIRSYRQLSSGKFKVIHELEKRLPANAYAYEWLVLGEGRDPAKYVPLTKAENVIPIVFAVVYIAIALVVWSS